MGQLILTGVAHSFMEEVSLQLDVSVDSAKILIGSCGKQWTVREGLGACSFFQQIFTDCFRFADTVLVSWVTGRGGKTDGPTIRLAQMPARSLDIS